MTASAADFLQVSGCKGKIWIHDCTFINPHDDPINVHGTFLPVEASEGPKLILKYAHPQTMGFTSVFPGDLLQFYNSNTLIPFDTPFKVLEARVPVRIIPGAWK